MADQLVLAKHSRPASFVTLPRFGRSTVVTR